MRMREKLHEKTLKIDIKVIKGNAWLLRILAAAQNTDSVVVYLKKEQKD